MCFSGRIACTLNFVQTQNLSPSSSKDSGLRSWMARSYVNIFMRHVEDMLCWLLYVIALRPQPSAPKQQKRKPYTYIIKDAGYTSWRRNTEREYACSNIHIKLCIGGYCKLLSVIQFCDHNYAFLSLVCDFLCLFFVCFVYIYNFARVFNLVFVIAIAYYAC